MRHVYGDDLRVVAGIISNFWEFEGNSEKFLLNAVQG